MDSITRIKEYIKKNFSSWIKVDYSEFDEKIDFRKDWSELYKINDEEIILISYTNISITGTDRPKPQLRVFLDEYKKPFYFAKKHQFRYYLFSIFTKEDEMARGLNNFNPKEYIISIETNLDKEGSRRDLRSIYDYANDKLKGRKFLKCSRSNYKADINQASFIYIGSQDHPEKDIFENFVNMFDSRPYLNSINEWPDDIKHAETLENVVNIYRPYITAIKSKPFLLLAGISGTGKSRIVRELARACWDEGTDEYKAQKPKNFQMVQVKPNWHDSSDLIGYVSRVSGKAEFVAGEFLKFIAKAWENTETPYFLCLDEMNLAPVEQYFAEYLSVIESRKSHEDGTVTTDPIVEKANEEWYFNLTASLTSDEDIRKQFNEQGICIPQNLIVVGTVNMDETTFSFSRKVLDRAMTIEMNEVDLHGGLTERNEPIGKLDKAELIGYAVDGVDVYAANKEVCETVLTYLDAVNSVLEGTPFKIAYRTRNEFLLYVVNNLPYKKGENDEEFPQGYVVARALDEITSMKVLSRIEGDDTKVSDKLLDSLTETIEEGLREVSGDENTVKSISLAKLKEMKDKLVSGYTSFWS
ncbi:McrB family protein [Prevotella denticola]|uniref:AAA domain (Dynein-related subfamily) n=1 Tax=Prevotella denticola TaxID=28129 RepID=A0A379E485_9BACT|nr:AAA family ATPase [Prevotella denticola]SUB87547.1 AAA domain (dynein-related subfamily) [Prevotella denticola]